MKSRRYFAVVAALMLTVVLLAHRGALAHGNDDVEELDAVEELDEIELSGEESSSLMSFLGEQHPAVIHFPIAWVTLIFLLELTNCRLKQPNLHRVGRYLLVLALLSFVPALVTGLIKAGQATFNDQYTSILEWHRNLNILTFLLTVGALFVRPKESMERVTGRVVTYRLLILAVTGLVLLSGHLGGRLVHG